MARASKSTCMLMYYCSSAHVHLLFQLYGQAVALFIWSLSGVYVLGKPYLFFPDHTALTITDGEGRNYEKNKSEKLVSCLLRSL